MVQYAEKLEDVRKKKLEEMIAAVRAGKPQGSAPKAAVPEKVAHHVRLAHMMLYPSSSCLLLILTGSGLFSLSYRLAVIFMPLVWRMVQLTSLRLTSQALSSRDTNRQPAAAVAPAKKPLRPAAAVHSQSNRGVADDDDAALQVGAGSRDSVWQVSLKV